MTKPVLRIHFILMRILDPGSTPKKNEYEIRIKVKNITLSFKDISTKEFSNCFSSFSRLFKLDENFKNKEIFNNLSFYQFKEF